MSLGAFYLRLAPALDDCTSREIMYCPTQYPNQKETKGEFRAMRVSMASIHGTAKAFWAPFLYAKFSWTGWLGVIFFFLFPVDKSLKLKVPHPI